MQPFLQKAGTASLAVLSGAILIGGSFLLTSGDVAYNSQSLVGAVLNAFNPNATVAISRNPASPSGAIIPGREQTLAVLDVKPRNLSQYAAITSLPVRITFAGSVGAVAATGFSLEYTYCLSSG